MVVHQCLTLYGTVVLKHYNMQLYRIMSDMFSIFSQVTVAVLQHAFLINSKIAKTTPTVTLRLACSSRFSCCCMGRAGKA